MNIQPFGRELAILGCLIIGIALFAAIIRCVFAEWMGW